MISDELQKLELILFEMESVQVGKTYVDQGYRFQPREDLWYEPVYENRLKHPPSARKRAAKRLKQIARTAEDQEEREKAKTLWNSYRKERIDDLKGFGCGACFLAGLLYVAYLVYQFFSK